MAEVWQISSFSSSLLHGWNNVVISDGGSTLVTCLSEQLQIKSQNNSLERFDKLLEAPCLCTHARQILSIFAKKIYTVKKESR